jgi:hypothetical protein
MTGTYRLARTGDVILNTRVSSCRDPHVLAAIDVLRTADVSHAHLEIPLHDFDRDDIFGAAEGAMAWYRGPAAVADELRWLGVDLVSTASNHALDYYYGGLRSTCAGQPRVAPLPAWVTLTTPASSSQSARSTRAPTGSPGLTCTR